MKLNDKIIEVLENNGFWTGDVTEQDNEYNIEMGQCTPLGEDWYEVIWFDGTDEGFVYSVRERYNNFDVDEEAEIWVEQRGRNGVPDSIRALVEDAEWKENALDALADELEDIIEEL